MSFQPPRRTFRTPWMVLFMLLLSTLTWAQSAPAQNPPVTTIQGTIQSVAATGVPMGTHLQVSVSGQIIDVYVGPKMLTGIDASAFHSGDTVQVSGTLVRRKNGIMLKAWRIQDGEQVYQIRHLDGKPVNPRRRPQ